MSLGGLEDNMNVNLIRQPLIAGILACLATSLPAAAQTTSGPYEPELSSIVMESAVDIANLKTPAALPAILVTLVQSGAAQLRSRVDNYDPIARTARTTLYLTAASAPLPLPAAGLPPAADPSMVSQSILRVDSFYYGKGTPLSVGMVGRFVTALGGSLPIAPGTPFLFSFAYPAEALNSGGSSSATFGESSFLIPGTLNLYSPAPVGSITVTPPASN